MVADLPDNYREHPKMLEFIRDVAVDWSDTKVLDAKVGDYVVVARKERNGDNWFVGGITNGEAREVVVDLSFLKSGKRYEATIYRDGDKAGWDSYPMDYAIENKSVKADNSLTIRMAEGGGFAISIKRID
jgi:alpha-glucosidase